MKEAIVRYTKVTPDIVKYNRKFYHDHVKSSFVRWCAFEGYFDSFMSPKELQAAKKGSLPEYLNIHHQVPLSGTDSEDVNSFINLTILHKETHKYINKEYFQKQLRAITNAPYGTEIDIIIPVFDYVDVEGIKKVLDKRNKSVYNIFVKDRQR